MADRLPLRDRIERDFTFHPPKDEDQTRRYNVLRSAAKDFALTIALMTPESREQSLAITALEEAVMWANAAVARNT